MRNLQFVSRDKSVDISGYFTTFSTNLEKIILLTMSITNPIQGASKPLLVAPTDGYTLVVDAAAYLHSKSAQGPKKFSGLVKYKECLKNHAAAIGGSATDGCGEFLAGGEEGTLEALKCSACNCHRNFHRKIYLQQQQVVVEPAAPRTELLRICEVAGGQGEGKKRFRTKFDEEQKEKMLRFAEKAGWKMQKADEAEVRSLCEEIGVKRKVLKVWMHNNKHQFANKTT